MNKGENNSFITTYLIFTEDINYGHIIVHVQVRSDNITKKKGMVSYLFHFCLPNDIETHCTYLAAKDRANHTKFGMYYSNVIV